MVEIDIGGIHGDGNINNIGENRIEGGQSITNNGEKSETAKIFQPLIKEAEGKPWPEDAPVDVVQAFPTPSLMLSAAQEQADQDISVYVPGEPVDEEQKKTWTQRFKALGPLLLSGGVAVGKAIADSYIDKSPTVAGLKAAFEFVEGKML